MRSFDLRRALLYSALALVAAALAGAAFAGALQRSGNWTEGLGWERAVLLGIDKDLPRLLDLFFLIIPWAGTNLTIWPLTVGAAAWLIVRRKRADLAAHLLTVQLGSLLLTALMKMMFGRPRPELWAHRGQYQWSAFPSGHAIIGMSLFFTIAIMLHRELGWRWPYGVALFVLLFNGYSRLYLGVHWPTDVLGGMLIGAVWLAGTQLAFRWAGTPGAREQYVGAGYDSSTAV